MTAQNYAIKNFLHKTSFRLDIPDEGMTRTFQLNSQETQLPGLTLTTVNPALNKQLKGTIAGTGVVFDPVNVRIILDEEMEAYTEILQWMVSTTDFKHNKSTHPSKLPKLMLIHVIDNEKRNIVCTFKYHNPFPVTIGSVDFSYAEDGNMAMQVDVQIAYTYYEVERNGKVISALPNTATQRGLHPSLRGV